ncbi:MAG TPA: YbgC/FadM family acyl-CoA thioesterase [Nitrospirae bacterium]|nr:YbgC/FadM family acyl-CoA thioesterase [Nitrospirota bacterium]
MKPHNYKKKIYYHDTDCGGVVYYANYLKYLEEARTEALLYRGINIKELSLKGFNFVVRKVNIEYKHPAHYQDDILITTDITKVKLSLIQLNQNIYHEDALLVQAETIILLVDKDLRPFSIPEEMKRALQ